MRRSRLMRLLDDRGVVDRITPALAVGVAREAVVAAYRGTLVAPPRQEVPAGGTELVFTVGGTVDGPSGFRVYGRWPENDDQLVVVWRADGRLLGIVTGRLLGAFRTGALGAVALDLLAPPELEVLAVVGAGRQAWTQVWAATAVRTPALVRVTSRDAGRREAFAARARAELGLAVTAVDDVRAAVAGAASVIVATTSATPVLEPDWLAPGCHVTTVGPKYSEGCELPLDLIRGADLVLSDSPAQLASTKDPLWTDTGVVHLGAALAGDVPHARLAAGQCRIFASAGLAGSEVMLAHRLLSMDGAGEALLGTE